jgi:diguanylate cyclase (GGDEF)-like protein/PAS domain S-box-containing protein
MDAGTMGFEDRPKTKLAEELESLQRQISELKDEVWEADSPQVTTCRPDEGRIKDEIEAQLGSVPIFLRSVWCIPELLEKAWRLTKVVYLENPLPPLFRETLLARLSRFCSVPHALVDHCSRLRQLGMPSVAIRHLLEQPAAVSSEGMEDIFSLFSSSSHPDQWPEVDSPLADGILECSILAFRNPGKANRCYRELQNLLGDHNYAWLMALIAYARICHQCLEANPDLTKESEEQTISAFRQLFGDDPPPTDLLELSINPEFRSSADTETGPVEPDEALTGHEHLVGQLIDSSPAGIFAFDLDFTITLWNSEMERISGVKREEAVGRPALDVFSAVPEIGESGHLLNVIRGETLDVTSRPYRIVETDREGFFEGKYSPILNDSNAVTGGFGIIRDITERKRVDEALRAVEVRYRELFEGAEDIVYTHDLEGNITSINRAAESITGYSRPEALRMNLTDFVSPDHQAVARKMIERHVAGESPATDELEILTKDGRRIALEIRSHLIFRDGVPFGVQGIARDVTQRKKTETALQQAKKNLEAWVDELEQRTREMTLLSEMGDMLRACLTTEEAYSVVVRVAQQIFPGQIGALYVIAPSRNLVEAAAAWGEPSLADRIFTPDECWALRRGRVHRVEDTQVDLLCQHLHQPTPAGYLCVPMMAQSEALGVLHLSQSEETSFTEARLRLALTMAEHIAMALSNLKLHETLRSQSIRDPLTGLFNRRFMEESLELELRRAARNPQPLGVIMLEIDGFLAAEQSQGRRTDDTVLVELGALLKNNIRKEDIACRLEGEKFTLVLPQGNPQAIEQRAEGLRQMIQGFEIRQGARVLGRFTVSMGMAVYPEHGRTVEALLQATDAALRRAKNEGGNRLVIAK